MAKRNFRAVMDRVYAHEGGFVDHPRDPGGATNMGITRNTLSAWLGRRATVGEVRALPRQVADDIYRSRYWNKLNCDSLPYGHDYVAMDGGVNSGTKRGAQWLQRGVGVKADGIVGPKTIEACRRAPATSISKAAAARMSFLRGLRHWSTFKRGWSRRVAEVEAGALRMWLQAAGGTYAATDALKQEAAKGPTRVKRVKQVGATQVGAAGGAGGVSGAEGTAWLAVLLFVLAALLAFRAYRRMQHEKDREAAFRKELANMET